MKLEAHSFSQASLSENGSRFGTDNVRGQISEHIFAPNGGCYLYFQLVLEELFNTHLLATANFKLGFSSNFDRPILAGWSFLCKFLPFVWTTSNSLQTKRKKTASKCQKLYKRDNDFIPTRFL